MSGPVTIEETTFDVQKAIAAVGYLVHRTGASMYSIMKMMYLADKMHLERYGRFIAGDHYVAMSQGPVPSCTYNMIKHVRGDLSGHLDYATAREYFAYEGDHKIVVHREPDYDELSGSDVECLDEIAAIFQKVGQWAVRDMSHDAAWNGAWSWGRRFFRRAVAMPVERIASQFEDGAAVLQHLRNSTPGAAEKPALDTRDCLAAG